MSKISKSDLILWMIGGVVIFFASIFIPFLYIGYKTGGYFELDFEAQVDSSIVNGILTADSVIFGFITFELRKISNRLKMASFLLALPIIFLLMWTVSEYFVDGVTLGYPTVNTLLMAVITFFYTILHFLYFMAMMKSYNLEVD